MTWNVSPLAAFSSLSSTMRFLISSTSVLTSFSVIFLSSSLELSSASSLAELSSVDSRVGASTTLAFDSSNVSDPLSEEERSSSHDGASGVGGISGLGRPPILLDDRKDSSLTFTSRITNTGTNTMLGSLSRRKQQQYLGLHILGILSRDDIAKSEQQNVLCIRYSPTVAI